MSQTLCDVLGGAHDPSVPALIVGSGGPTFTRRDIHQAAVRFAATLTASGIVKPGDTVTLVDSNTVEFVVAFLGVTYSRAVVAPLNQNYTQAEFEYYMEDSGSKLVVTGHTGIPAAEAAAASEENPTPAIALSFGAASEGGDPVFDVALRHGDLQLAVAPPVASLSELPRPDDVALFLHTSGTTARPKGVPLSHANLMASLKNICDTYEFTPEDVSLLVMPLFHVHGLMAGLLAPLSAGATVVIPAAGKFSATAFWPDAVAHGATFYTAVPTMHQILVARAETDFPKDTPPPLRVIRSCSASLAPATLHKLEAAFGAPVLEAYAMTEASHQMTSNPLPKHGAHKPGTVGKPQGTVQLTILGSGPQFQQLPPGQAGEVCIRGPNVTSGYMNNPKANEEAFGGGWFHTGDEGYLDEEGFLTLTGRIKELINRGGEKISPLEVDATLMAHPWVAEAVSFAEPDEKYGEVVAVGVVLTAEGKKELAGGTDVVGSIKAHCGARLVAFKVPGKVFITEELPKTATGKVQRRIVAAAFLKPQLEPVPAVKQQLALPADGCFLAARALARLGVTSMFGCVGIPVTNLASAAQACGIRYIGCRNEQAAGYAAAATGFLTGTPGVLLTVSGPGVVHGIAGLSNAQTNCWPMIMLSGSCESGEVGKGAFQELDQVAAVEGMWVKFAVQATSCENIPTCIAGALAAAISGRPGAAYVDIPSDVLMQSVQDAAAAEALIVALPESLSHQQRAAAASADVSEAAELMRAAQSPLIVVGKGAAFAQAESSVRALVDGWGVPFLATSMGRGVVPEDHPMCVNSARSIALAEADVVLVFGSRLNWQLHFGEQPKWSGGVKFILVDPEPTDRDAALAAACLRGDAGAVADQLLAALPAGGRGAAAGEWTQTLTAKAATARTKLEESLARHKAHPLDFKAALRAVKDELAAVAPAPIVVSEGANTMDNARLILSPVNEPRTRLDAGTWGTMGVGPGYALAAAVAFPERCVVAVEGDSAFGFSAMEVETACRYNLPVTFIVFNNGGIYGGDRRASELQTLAAAGLSAAGYASDPAPTSFVPGARYDHLAVAFGGVGVHVEDAEGLQAALKAALASRKATVIDVAIDPQAGVESGNVHAFNALKK